MIRENIGEGVFAGVMSIPQYASAESRVSGVVVPETLV
jgi:hypothetical protein